MEKTEKAKVLNLGKLKIILVKDKKRSVTVKALVQAGSREETDREAGSAHFLEHFVFKGTKKYKGEFDVHEAVEKVGGIHNAYTSWDQIAFYATMDREHLPLAASLVGQMVSEPLLPEAHFDRERGTILEELYMYEDLPEMKANEEAIKMVWNKDNLGRPIIGTVESLKNMKLADLKQYYTNWFVPENVIVGVSGDWGSDDKLLKVIDKEFGTLMSRESKVAAKDTYVAANQSEKQLKLIKRQTEQANVAFGFEGLSVHDEDKHALVLANLILGGSTMSRLFREVREKRGWAYHVRSDNDQLSDTGIVSVCGGVPKAKMLEAVGLMGEIILGLRAGKWQITKEEVQMAKDTIKGRLALTFDNSERVISMALEDMMYLGKVRTYEDRIAEFEEVTWDMVISACERVFIESKMNLAVVGDYDNLKGI